MWSHTKPKLTLFCDSKTFSELVMELDKLTPTDVIAVELNKNIVSVAKPNDKTFMLYDANRISGKKVSSSKEDLSNTLLASGQKIHPDEKLKFWQYTEVTLERAVWLSLDQSDANPVSIIQRSPTPPIQPKAKTT